jgi:hypothetical protein
VSLGVSIFLSTVLLGFIILFTSTKDRWKWKKIILRLIIGLLTLSSILGISFYLYSYIENKPKKQTIFWGISLSSTKEDIKFAKGSPEENKNDNRWIYKIKDSTYSDDYSLYIIQFNDDNKIRYIGFWGNDWLSSPYLQGLRLKSKYDEVINKFGPPSYVSRSDDDLKITLSFDKYNVFFAFEQNEVGFSGIYNPTLGPVKFVKEKAQL